MAKGMGTGAKVAIGVGVVGVGVYALWRFWLKDQMGGGEQGTQDAGQGTATAPTQTWDPSTNWGTPDIPAASAAQGAATAQPGRDNSGQWPAAFTLGQWRFRLLTAKEVSTHQASGQLQDATTEARSKFPKIGELMDKRFGAGSWAVYVRADVKGVYFVGVQGHWYKAAA